MKLDILYAEAKQTARDLKMQVPPKHYEAELKKLAKEFKRNLKAAAETFAQEADPQSKHLQRLLTRMDNIETQLEDLKKKVDDEIVQLSAILKENNLKIAELKPRVNGEDAPLFFDLLDVTARTTMQDYEDVYLYNFKYLMVKIAVVAVLLMLIGSSATFGFFAVLYIGWMVFSMAMGWSDDPDEIVINK
jgi:hypothetical protein